MIKSMIMDINNGKNLGRYRDINYEDEDIHWLVKNNSNDVVIKILHKIKYYHVGFMLLNECSFEVFKYIIKSRIEYNLHDYIDINSLNENKVNKYKKYLFKYSGDVIFDIYKFNSLSCMNISKYINISKFIKVPELNYIELIPMFILKNDRMCFCLLKKYLSKDEKDELINELVNIKIKNKAFYIEELSK